ncbi:MAG: NYN domain-containing protein [Candidatus Paceibacterota bacterium]
MTQNPSQRVGVFVDVQNVYHSAKNLSNARVNFTELLKTIVNKRDLIRALAYVVKSETATGERSFFEALEKAGFELRVKDLQIFSSGYKKADWDVGIAVDAIRMADNLDVVVLVTGDGDFTPLVEYLQWGKGKQVEVVAFSKTTSSMLRDECDIFVELENIPKILMDIPDKNNNKKSKKKKSKRKNKK